jgi:hypothetical protein
MPKKHSRPQPQPPMVLRWQFRLNDRFLTCGITPSGSRTFDVVTVPHWDVSSGSVETFHCATAALRRHATIASELREAGWTAASYTR